MYIEQSNFREYYEKHILSTTLQDDRKICIFVNGHQVDALCACFILIELLKQDYQSFTLITLSGYQHFMTELSQTEPEQYKLMICLNVGGILDLSEFISNEEIPIWILDTQKPWHLDNLFQHFHIYIWDDGELEQLEEERAAYFYLKQFEDEFDSESEDEESDEESDEEDDELSDKENQSQGNEERKKMKEKKKRIREARELIENYYSMTWQGSCSSFLMYQLSSQLGKRSTSFLWLAMVGMTEQWMKQFLTIDQYEYQVELFKQELNLLSANPQQLFMGYQIVHLESELNLPLYRHWTVEEAMENCPHLVARLGLWKESGRKKLFHLYVKLGLQLTEIQKHFYSLTPELKSILFSDFPVISKQYPFLLTLTDFPSFGLIPSTIQSVSTSAVDWWYSLSCLLELENVPTLEHEHSFYLGLEAIRQVLHQGMNQSLQEDSKDSILLLGCRWSQHLLKQLNQATLRIMEERKLKLLKKYWLCLVDEDLFHIKEKPIFGLEGFKGSTEEKSLLQHYSMESWLLRLAWMLVECLRATKWMHSKQKGTEDPESGEREVLPLVLAVGRGNIFYLAGVDGSSFLPREEGQKGYFENQRRSPFTSIFQNCATKTRAKVKLDRFDQGLIQVEKKDLTKMLECLYHEMNVSNFL